jgi:hypothetical protein
MRDGPYTAIQGPYAGLRVAAQNTNSVTTRKGFDVDLVASTFSSSSRRRSDLSSCHSWRISRRGSWAPIQGRRVTRDRLPHLAILPWFPSFICVDLSMEFICYL